MSQKALDPPTPSAPSSSDASIGTVPSAAPAIAQTPGGALSTALRTFIQTLQQQTARHTDIIDIFARALKEMNRELKQEKVRREISDRHLQEAQSRIARLEKTVQALARQSWVH